MQQSNFDKFSSNWWDKDGPMKLLHSMNETRMLFIKERILHRYQKLGSLKSILDKKKILDLGCGGGILSESLADLGGNVFAIDKSKKLINTAKNRAAKKNLDIQYECAEINNLSKKKLKFDVIISLEVVEHVDNLKFFLLETFKCLNKNGLIIFSTINRSKISYLTTILLAEKILKIVPNNTHDWDKYVKPEEIITFSKKYNCKLDKITGLLPFPSLNGFKWLRVKNVKSNYIISLIN